MTGEIGDIKEHGRKIKGAFGGAAEALGRAMETKLSGNKGKQQKATKDLFTEGVFQIGDRVTAGEQAERNRIGMRAGGPLYGDFTISGFKTVEIDGEQKEVPELVITGTNKMLSIDELNKAMLWELSHITTHGQALVSEIENRKTSGWIDIAEAVALTHETDKEIAMEKVQKMGNEYNAFVAILDYWHLAIGGERGVYFHNISMGKETFDNGITKGDTASRWFAYLAQSEYGKSFLKGFGTPREKFKNEEFSNAFEALGAMMRGGSLIADKDSLKRDKDEKGKDKKDKKGRPIMVPKNDEDTPRIYVNGRRARFLNRDGTTTDRIGTGNATYYEIHKNRMKLYEIKYTESRMEFEAAAVEFIDYQKNPDGSYVIDKDTKNPIPIYKCHIDPQWTQAYDAFQMPMMAGFWYDNLENLPEEVVLQLGGRRLSENGSENLRLNKLLLGTAKSLLDASADDRRLLFEKLGVEWSEDWEMADKYDCLESLGLIRRKEKSSGESTETGLPFDELFWGAGENYLLTTRLMCLQTHRISVETWQKLKWDKLWPDPGQDINTFGNLCQQMMYLQKTRGEYIKLLLGNDIVKAAEFLKSTEAFQHIPDILSPEALSERRWPIEVLSPMFMQSVFIARMQGRRLKEVGQPIREFARMGVFNRHYAQKAHRFGVEPGKGFDNMDMKPWNMSERVAINLGDMNDEKIWVRYLSKVVEGTQFEKLAKTKEGKRALWWSLVSFAGLAVKSNKDEISPAGKNEYSGFYILRDRAEGKNKNEVYSDGRVVQYYNFEDKPDKRRKWGKKVVGQALEEIGGFGENAFEELMQLYGDGLQNILNKEAYEEAYATQALENQLPAPENLGEHLTGIMRPLRTFLRTKKQEKIAEEPEGKKAKNKLLPTGLFSTFRGFEDKERIIYSLVREYFDEDYVDNTGKHYYREIDRDENGTGAIVFEGLDEFGNPKPKLAQNHDLRGRLNEGNCGLLWDPLKRDELVQQTLRDMRDPITGEFIIEQPQTDGRDVSCFYKDEDGKPIIVKGKNVVYEKRSIRLADGTDKSIGWHPVMDLFHRDASFSSHNGQDPLWTILAGTGEKWIGQDYRLTPLRIHFQRDEDMYFLTLLTDSIRFRKGIFIAEGKDPIRDWIDELGMCYLANPLKKEQMLDMIGQGENDPNWKAKWRERWNLGNRKSLQEYLEDRIEIEIPNLEKGQARSLEEEKELTQVGLKAHELFTAALGPAKGVGGIFKPLVESFSSPRKFVTHAITGTITGAVTNAAIGSFFYGAQAIASVAASLSGATVAAPTLIQAQLWEAVTSLAGGNIAPALIVEGLLLYAGGLPWVSVLNRNSGFTENGRERLKYQKGIIASARRLFQENVPGATYRDRLEKQSFPKMAWGDDERHDDLVPAQGFVKATILDVKEAYPPNAIK